MLSERPRRQKPKAPTKEIEYPTKGEVRCENTLLNETASYGQLEKLLNLITHGPSKNPTLLEVIN